MTAARFACVILIFLAVGAAWLILGGTIDYRTGELDKTMTQEVNNLWGPAGLVQQAPVLEGPASTGMTTSALFDPTASNIKVAFEHEDRYKGLLWFSVYKVQFTGEYTFQTFEVKGGLAQVVFRMPEGVKSFEDFTIQVDGLTHSTAIAGGAINVPLLTDGKKHTVNVAYKARGRDQWQYATAPADGSHMPFVQDFTMTATMNFADIDYPKGSVSPVDRATISGNTATATWKYNNLQAIQKMGVDMPRRENAGPVAARMSYFAPVSLFFFFTVLFTIVLLKKVPLHPMHYLFISAGFFAFHILLAYLVDVIDLELAFWICAAVSVLLVVGYMTLVVGARFAATYIALAQLAYLIGFSYAFLWTGQTGRAIVIGAIITLACLMVATAKVNWNEVFASKPPHRQPVYVIPDEPPPPPRA